LGHKRRLEWVGRKPLIYSEKHRLGIRLK
jgi:hypothetical protein